MRNSGSNQIDVHVKKIRVVGGARNRVTTLRFYL